MESGGVVIGGGIVVLVCDGDVVTAMNGDVAGQVVEVVVADEGIVVADDGIIVPGDGAAIINHGVVVINDNIVVIDGGIMISNDTRYGRGTIG